MKSTLIIILTLFSVINSQSQNFHLTSWSGYNRTAYKLQGFESSESFLSYGARVAVGFEKFQFGVEYESHLTDPSFISKDPSGVETQRDQFSNTYYGGLVRFNTAKVPAYRLGLVLKAGAGVYETTNETYQLPDDILSNTVTYPDKYLGFNVGVGISAPIYRFFHWELHYQLNYARRPELNAIPSYDALHHSLQLGVSLNFVFGEAARRSKRVLDSKK